MVTVHRQKDLTNCTVFEFKVETIRVVTENKGKENEQVSATMTIDIQNYPVGMWWDTNLREQNFQTVVAKNIKDSLLESEEDNFHILNRGILLSVYHLEVYEHNGDKYIRIYLKDRTKHGNVDGLHTEKLILAHRQNVLHKKRVSVEILTGIEEYFEELAAARNTSVQVTEKSKLELQKKFDFIKEALSDKYYANDIAYKEYQQGTIDIVDIIAILGMFNIDRYPNTKANKHFPTSAYSRKSTCMKWFAEDSKKSEHNPYAKMIPIIGDILDLYDQLESKLPVYFNQSTPNSRYGRLRGVTTAQNPPGFKRVYANQEAYSDYASPNGFIYPILGAFRFLVEEVDNQYKWKTDPKEVLDEIGADLVATLIEAHRGLGNNPNATGKFVNLWNQLYDKVKLHYLESNM